MPTNAGRPEIETAQASEASHAITVGAADTFYEVTLDTEDFADGITTTLASNGIDVLPGAKYLAEVDVDAVVSASGTPTMNVRVALSDDTALVSLKNQVLSTTAARYADAAVFTATARGVAQLQVANDTGTENITVTRARLRLTRID
jgi:hypothetical protein